uniref:G-protein coupled receptors family 1 profile domain-containing protein n=1 Tax=Timema shepardi TaxID=629360 RepID=A0A7R9G0E5_TIMSH|nr:unnamed protein product [Timema shepardi]
MEIYPVEGDDINGTSSLLYGFDGIYLFLGASAENYSLINETNVTIDLNSTYFIVRDSFYPYPSGYSLVEIIFASIVMTFMMIVVVVGNMLVIIAIATEKALKNIQNWFIASLAVADFFLGLVIMPFSLANEIMGYWIFGHWWCDIHSAMDVLLSTASIMNLCLISLDRYWSITQAVDYLKKRTPLRAAVMITLVWILSGLICIPPLLGWKVARVIEEYPKCQAYWCLHLQVLGVALWTGMPPPSNGLNSVCLTADERLRWQRGGVRLRVRAPEVLGSLGSGPHYSCGGRHESRVSVPSVSDWKGWEELVLASPGIQPEPEHATLCGCGGLS